MFAFWPSHPIGEPEFLFCFPFCFPVLGFALSLYWSSLERIVAAFHVGALAMLLATLLATTRFHDVASGDTVSPLIQNNQIHGAVCCGIMFITSCFWLLHYATEEGTDRRLVLLASLTAPLLMGLSLFCIYGAKSKGVWLALVLSLPVLAGIIVWRLRIGRGALVVFAMIPVLIGGTYAVHANLERFAGPTASATLSLLQGIRSDKDPATEVASTIASTATPLSMDERLQLWWNASELISASPVVGWGNEWLPRWHLAKYGAIKYDLMHNGYLEILVRYVLVRALVFSILIASFAASVYRASRRGLVPPSAFHAYVTVLFFFGLTLLSNSNNRLAVGESLALVSSALPAHVALWTT